MVAWPEASFTAVARVRRTKELNMVAFLDRATKMQGEYGKRRLGLESDLFERMDVDRRRATHRGRKE